MMKRAFDIAISGLGLLILSPLFLVVAIWIKLDSKGPVIYAQKRVGRYKRDFTIYKFRSMRSGDGSDKLITIGSRDPRITRPGHYIRKYKLDELPQLFNVFIGDMSLVGPRPEVRKYVNLYTPEQEKVFDVRPGITDPASIRYHNEAELLAQAQDPESYYTQVVMPDKLRLNLEYVRQHSFWQDVRLILRTLRIISSQGDI